MKRIYFFLLLLLPLVTAAQVYNPSQHILSSTAIGYSNATPTDGRSMFYDNTFFKYRDFQSTAEVTTYLSLKKYRSGHFPIYVHSGGTLAVGVWTGGTAVTYSFQNGTADSDLIAVGITDTISMSNRVNDRVKYADTVLMFAPYARQSVVFTKTEADDRYLQSFTEDDPKRVTGIAFTGAATKTATITLADSSTATGTFTDAVESVDGLTGAVSLVNNYIRHQNATALTTPQMEGFSVAGNTFTYGITHSVLSNVTDFLTVGFPAFPGGSGYVIRANGGIAAAGSMDAAQFTLSNEVFNDRVLPLDGAHTIMSDIIRFTSFAGTDRNNVVIYNSTGDVALNGASSGMGLPVDPGVRLFVNGPASFENGPLKLPTNPIDYTFPPTNGHLYYNTVANKVKLYTAGAFQNVATEAFVLTQIQAGLVVTVDKNNVNATDIRTGLSPYSITAPFLTINAAKTAGTYGDILLIRNGYYSESVVFVNTYPPQYTNFSIIVVENATVDGGAASAFLFSGNWYTTLFLNNGHLVNTGSAADPRGTAALYATNAGRVSVFGNNRYLSGISSVHSAAYICDYSSGYYLDNISLTSTNYIAFGGSYYCAATMTTCNVVSTNFVALAGMGLDATNCFISGKLGAYSQSGTAGGSADFVFNIKSCELVSSDGYGIGNFHAGGPYGTDYGKVINSSITCATRAMEGINTGNFGYKIKIENTKITMKDTCGAAISMPAVLGYPGDFTAYNLVNVICNVPIMYPGLRAYMNAANRIIEVNTSISSLGVFFGVNVGFGVAVPTATLALQGTAIIDVTKAAYSSADSMYVRDATTGLMKIVPQIVRSGSVTLTPNSILTTFTVTHDASFTPAIVMATPTNAAATYPFYINNKTSTTFDIVFLTAPASGVSLTLDWIVKP